VQKVMDDTNIKLTAAASNIFGVYVQAIIRTFLEADIMKDELANLVKKLVAAAGYPLQSSHLVELSYSPRTM
jgi:hypothetical protein